MARVFVSHASEDLALAHELHRWLVDDGHQVFLDQDLCDGVAVGEEWEQRLHERLRWANAVVCVVTSAYLASQWCTAEVSIARSRGNRLLPVRAEPGVAHVLLKPIQHTDMTQDWVTAHAALAEALRRIDDAGESDWPDDQSPFPGLRPFDVDRHRVFFGRAGEVEQLAESLRSIIERAEGAALLVVGPSGCGKSSLVRAGLLPVMAGEPGWWTLPPIVPGADPVAALARGLTVAAREIDLDWTVEHVHHQLHEANLMGLATELLLAAPGGSQRRLLVVVDQFEELLTQAPLAERARFVEVLRPTLTGPVQLVGTLRPEFLDQLLGDPELAALPTHTYVLRPLRREALRAVIEEPARLTGIGVNERLVARLIEDTDSGEALPLLAFTLAQLAEGIGRGGQLSQTRYEQLGGVQGALTREADAALADAVAAGGRSREEVIAGLLWLVTVNEQGRPTRWRVRHDELPNSVSTALDPFVARRLLSTDTDNGTAVIGVAHEAFLSAWPPLRDSIAASASALRARRTIEHAATDWHDHGRLPTRVWGGGQLAAAVANIGARIGTGPTNLSPPLKRGPVPWPPRRHRVLATDRVSLSPTARDFLYTSIRCDRYRRRRSITVLSVLLVLALVGAGIAVTQQRAAQLQQRIATARQLVAQADAIRDTNPRTALQLGIAAQRIHPDEETHSSLVNILTHTRYAEALTGHTGAVSSGVFTPDAHALATADSDGKVILWDLTDRTRPHPVGPPLTVHTDSVRSVVAFAHDGHTMATTDSNGAMILWDLTDPARPHPVGPPLTAHTFPVDGAVFAPDGHTLVTASSYDGTVIVWDLTDRTRPQPLGQPLDHINSVVAFAHDGHTMATTDSNGAMILWDLTDPALPQPLGQPLDHAGAVSSGVFAPDGHTLVTASYDGTVTLWDLTDRARPHPVGPPLTAHTGPVYSVAFAPDGSTLATGGEDRTVILWDLTDRARPHPVGPPLTAPSGSVLSAAFGPDGHSLATANSNSDGPGGSEDTDDTVILWDLTNSAQPPSLAQRLTGHNDPLRSAAFAPDGRTLAAARYGGTVILWDLANRARPQPLGQPPTAHSDSMLSVAFAPDGHTLATGGGNGMIGSNGTVILWDVTDRARPQPLGQPLTAHTGYVESMAFAPDGHTLATGGGNGMIGSNGTVILWDVTDRARPQPLGQPLDHTGPVYSVAFAPDGHTLVTGGDDSVILWDLTDRARPQPLGQPLTTHTGASPPTVFAPDGHTLATGDSNDDSALILWDLRGLNDLRKHAVERACSITRRGLDRDEWARYVSGLSYQDTCPD